MNYQRNVQEFDYKGELTIIPLSIVLISFPLLIILEILLIFVFIQGKIAFADELWDTFVIISLALVILFVGPVRYLNQFNKIQVLDNGIRVRVFFLVYYWVFVPWGSILAIEKLKAIDRWRKPMMIITIDRGLTICHRLLSLQYGKGIKPGIIISSDLNNYCDLINIIEEKVKGNK